MRQCISCLQASRMPVLHLSWRSCIILTMSLMYRESSWVNKQRSKLNLYEFLLTDNFVWYVCHS
jgi:hypothetical protein